jgi:cobalt-zinc-cadmium efflux system protein
VRRLFEPPHVTEGVTVAAAAFAVAANLAAIAVLRGLGDSSMNVRAAYLEVLSDLAGAVAVLVAGGVIASTGWLQADAIASIAIGILILARTVRLLRDALNVLLEATPKNVDLAEVRRHILEAKGVADVHDLHAWTITSGMNVLSAHVVLREGAEPGAALDELGDCLAHDFDIEHSTFQLETPEHVRWEANRERAPL